MLEVMRAVIDTNILVSAIWSANGAPAAIVEKMLEGTFKPVFDNRIMEEYREVLTRSKFSFDEQRVDCLLDAIKLIGIQVSPTPYEGDLPDNDDRAFLESALNADAYLVTGNTRHFPGFEMVITPAEFIKVLVS